MRKKLWNYNEQRFIEYELAIATYTHKSVCSCGFPALNESVPLGRRYRAVVETIRQTDMGCGGCGRIFPVDVVNVQREDEMGDYFPIPLAVLNPKEQWER